MWNAYMFPKYRLDLADHLFAFWSPCSGELKCQVLLRLPRHPCELKAFHFLLTWLTFLLLTQISARVNRCINITVQRKQCLQGHKYDVSSTLNHAGFNTYKNNTCNTKHHWVISQLWTTHSDTILHRFFNINKFVPRTSKFDIKFTWSQSKNLKI